MALYTGKRVKKLCARLREEYEGALKAQRDVRAALEEENKILKARLLKLESEREGAIGALTAAEAEGQRIRAEAEKEAENRRKELCLLAEKCRQLAARIEREHPDGEEAAELAAFRTALARELGLPAEESEFDMDEVLAPKKPLDLSKLCKELGLMEDEG